MRGDAGCEHARLEVRERGGLGVLGLALVALTWLLAPAAAQAGVNDYPANLRNAAQDSVTDPWGYPNRECTSFAAFRLNSRNGVGFNAHYGGAFWGNANSWDEAARAAGIAVNGSPAVGALAQSNAGSAGHVAWVESVGNGTVTIEEYNHDFAGHYSERTVPTSNYNYIHVRDLSGAPVEGEFIKVPTGPEVYRVVGGAPLYVSSWANVGGSKPVHTVTQAQFNALAPYPADGTFVSAADGRVYRIAGGAPLYVSSWSAVGGAHPATLIDQWDIDNPQDPHAHLRQFPADGTFLGSSNGRVYRVAGGAPIYVSTWDAVGGPQPSVGIDQWAIDNPQDPHAHLRKYPADGTFLGGSDGRVYRVAGGAPIYVSNWDAVGGPQPSVGIDRWAIENPQDPNAHLRRYPADGTFLGSSGGGVYRVAGGAPLYVSNWDAVGGPQPSVGIDQWAIDNPQDPHAHLRRYPANGTFLNSSTGSVYRVAGGAALPLSSWSLFGGVQPYTTVDGWDVAHPGDPLAHLTRAPANGTIVRGLPSGKYWAFKGGRRRPAKPNFLATGIDDIALRAFPRVRSHRGHKGRHGHKPTEL